MTVTWGSLTSELPESGGLKMRKTPRALPAIWLQRSCVGKTTRPLLIILQLVWWLMNVCSAEDPMSERAERRSEITFCPSKFRSRREKCLEGGLSRLPTSLTRWSRESPRTGLEIKALKKSWTILGWETSLGKICVKSEYNLLSFHPKKTTSTRRTFKKSGKTSTILISRTT